MIDTVKPDDPDSSRSALTAATDVLDGLAKDLRTAFEHEARNDSDQLRVILMFDVWNPLLSQAERDMVVALASAMRDYRVASDP